MVHLLQKKKRQCIFKNENKLSVFWQNLGELPFTEQPMEMDWETQCGQIQRKYYLKIILKTVFISLQLSVPRLKTQDVWAPLSSSSQSLQFPEMNGRRHDGIGGITFHLGDKP